MTTFAWIDVETTGLEPGRHQIIEVAAIVTDAKLKELGRFHSVVKASGDFRFADPRALTFHEKSGLLAECLDPSAPDRSAVERDLGAFLSSHKLGDMVLSGSTVHFDARFLRADMPGVMNLMHYRQLDVSAIKLAYKFFCGDTGGFVEPNPKPHRAMADIECSIAEFKHYINKMRVLPGGNIQNSVDKQPPVS